MTRTSARTVVRTTVAGAVAAMTISGTVTGAVLVGAAGAQAEDGRQLTGTWRVTVDPDPAPDGTDLAPFVSTIVYTASGSVVEATSRGPMSAGLGTWDRLGAGQFATSVEKYRFGPSGAPVGSTRIEEVQTVAPGGDSYTGRATTYVLDPSGRAVQTFTSTVTAERL